MTAEIISIENYNDYLCKQEQLSLPSAFASSSAGGFSTAGVILQTSTPKQV